MSQYRQPVPYFQSGNPETDEYKTSYTFLNGTNLPYYGMLGAIAEFDQGSAGARNICTYQLVKVATGVTGVVGNVLYWSDKGAYTVTTTKSGHLAGICRIAMAAAASYIWMLKKGDRTVLFVAAPTVAPTTAGLPVVGSDTAGKADALANVVAQAAFPLIGTTLGATTDDLASVRVNIPDVY